MLSSYLIRVYWCRIGSLIRYQFFFFWSVNFCSCKSLVRLLILIVSVHEESYQTEGTDQEEGNNEGTWASWSSLIRCIFTWQVNYLFFVNNCSRSLVNRYPLSCDWIELLGLAIVRVILKSWLLFWVFNVCGWVTVYWSWSICRSGCTSWVWLWEWCIRL